MLTRNGYGKAVDWWSLGALTFEMLVGRAPFTAKSQKDLDRKILSEKLVCPSYLTAHAHSLLKGMLEKDINKRLGASKTTMFSIGGVAALKRHPFFDDLDWAALLALELEPPIDLSKAYDNPNSIATTAAAAAAASASASAKPPGGSDGLDMDDLTKHFHEGFTGQRISLSVVEDTLSVSTPGSCSRTRSRANSDCHTIASERDKHGDLYADFEFVGVDGGSFECSADQVRRFEEGLAAKQKKQAKKAKMKEKVAGERAGKAAQEEAEREACAAAAQADQARLAREAQERAARAAQAAALARAAAARSEATEARRRRRADMCAARAEHEAKEKEVQRKLKALRKKQRDISELEARVAAGLLPAPSAEQKEKLARKQAVEDDIMEMEEEEEGLAASRPPPVPDDDEGGDAEAEEKAGKLGGLCAAVTAGPAAGGAADERAPADEEKKGSIAAAAVAAQEAPRAPTTDTSPSPWRSPTVASKLTMAPSPPAAKSSEPSPAPASAPASAPAPAVVDEWATVVGPKKRKGK